MSLHDNENNLIIKTTISLKCLPAYNSELNHINANICLRRAAFSDSSTSTCRHIVLGHVVMFTRMHTPAIYGAKSQTSTDRPLPEQFLYLHFRERLSGRLPFFRCLLFHFCEVLRDSGMEKGILPEES